MPDVPRGRPAAPGDSVPYPRARGVDQLSRATGARVQGPTGSTSLPGLLRPGPECPRCPLAVRGVGHGSKSPRGGPALPGASGTSLRTCVVGQLSRSTQVLFRVPEVSTICPWQLGPMSEA